VVAPKKIEGISTVISQKDTGVEGVKTIVLDAGHGGKDPGATGITGILEKNVVLDITLKVRDLLKKQSKLKLLLTRDKDVFIPLSDRTKFANEKKADLFISVHADAVPGNFKRKENARGYKIYFLSQAKNEEDKMVAMRENAVIELEEKPQNYSSLQNVLIDLAGNEFLSESQDLCILLDQKFNSSLDKKITKLHLGVGQANFWVLNGAYMPSVLIETGFLSNPSEEKLLSDKKFQSQMAQAICEAILGFKNKYETGL
jgi:N-acetylmuramoyl-L-alanine amidase